MKKCPICGKKMIVLARVMPKEKIPYACYQCTNCGEEILDMKQLEILSKEYEKLRQSKETTFSLWGNALGIRVPKDIATLFNIHPGTRARISKDEKGILITPLP